MNFSYLNRQRRLWAPGLDAIRPKVSFGSNKVNLFLRTLLTCSTSRAKCRVEPRPNLIWRLSITSCTVVEVSYLNDLVWPFSRKTLRTLGINGATESAPDNWLWPYKTQNFNDKFFWNVFAPFYHILFPGSPVLVC